MLGILGQARYSPPLCTTPDTCRSPGSFLPRSPAAVRDRPLTTRTAGPSPGRFFCNLRTSTRPGSRIESGMRRSVFSFVLGEPALRLDGRDYLIGEILGALLCQQVRRCIHPVDCQTADGDESPTQIQPIYFTGQNIGFDGFV